MRTLHTMIAVFCFLFCASLAFAQPYTGNFQTVQTGNWSDLSTWNYNGGAAPAAPDSNAGTIDILSNHAVTVTSSVAVDSVTVNNLASLIINSGVTVTVGDNNGGYGISVNTGGTMTVNGTVVNKGSVSSSGTLTFANGSVYNHARINGSIPIATWSVGSTCLITGYITGGKPGNANQNYYNYIWNCTGQTSNVDVGWYNNTIGGDVTCYSSGSARVYFTSPGAGTPNTITINGNVNLVGGTMSTNGSSSAADITIEHHGNIRVTAGNFGCSRGSAPNVTWNIYGDSLTASNCTLQNSSTTPFVIQKFAFAKTGTQVLNLSNITYGSGSSPVSIDIKSGSILDIGASAFPVNNKGCLQLLDGGTLISPAGADISCTAEYSGDGNTFVTSANATGTGNITVLATGSAHANIPDPAKSISRYWTITADPGVTQADLRFHYLATDINGTETNYVPMRYTGSGTSWALGAAINSVDATYHFVTGSAVTNFNGDWTIGESDMTGVRPTSTGTNPRSFYVNQNYPNPFNPMTQITYGIPHTSFVTVKIFNLLGQEVATVFSGNQVVGNYVLDFDGSKLCSGVYIYRIQADNFVQTKKMMLMK